MSQSYQFAHRVLPRWFFEAPERVAGILSGAEAMPHLIALWKEVGRVVEEDGPSEGMAVEQVSWDGFQGVLITPPPPRETPEAHFLCLIWPSLQGPNAGRILTLELSIDLFKNEPRTVMGEWRSDGAHLNFGAGPSVDSEAFLEAVQRLVLKA